MRSHLNLRLLSLVVCVLGAVVLVSGAQRPVAGSAVSLGLTNPGFESGVTGGLPSGWTAAQPIPDVVQVVGAEGPAQFPTYGDMGNIAVSPYKGNLMLRLGTPKRTSQSQSNGINSVSQTFTANDSTLLFSFRLFSWEPRGRDTFRFDLRSGIQSVGSLSEPLVVAMGGGVNGTCSSMPCQFGVDTAGAGQFLDSGWREVRINNVPTGVPLTDLCHRWDGRLGVRHVGVLR
jgi:hypothetical protein